MTRAAVRTISGYAGINPPKDVIELKLDQDQVYLGSEVTGFVRVLGRTAIKSVHLLLEGIEYSTVAFQNHEDEEMGIEELRRNTTDTRTIVKQEMLLDCSKPQRFKFFLPETLPGAMRFILKGSNPTLPSQFQIKYHVLATMYGNSSKTQVAHNLVVLTNEEVSVPIDQAISLCIKSKADVFFKAIFACGLSAGADMEESLAEDRYIVLQPSPESLNLVPGQQVKIFVQDWFGIFSHPDNMWMIRLVERRTWKAKGRVARSRECWDIMANLQTLPKNVRRSYDYDPNALLKVAHEITVYVVRRNTPKTVLATTKPIPVQIITTTFAGDL